MDIARPAGSLWIVVRLDKRHGWRRSRKQGKNNEATPEIVFLANARSISHTVDELVFFIAANGSVRACCVSIITVTWLHPAIPNTAV